MAEHYHYKSIPECIREAVREKVERHLPLSKEVQKRIDEARATPDKEYIPYGDVKEKHDPR